MIMLEIGNKNKTFEENDPTVKKLGLHTFYRQRRIEEEGWSVASVTRAVCDVVRY